jgi:hypothetical protein
LPAVSLWSATLAGTSALVSDLQLSRKTSLTKAESDAAEESVRDRLRAFEAPPRPGTLGRRLD